MQTTRDTRRPPITPTSTARPTRQVSRSLAEKPWKHLRRSNPSDLTVDIRGTLYVTDSGRNGRNRVWKLAGGADAPTLLAFAGVKSRSVAAANALSDVHLQDDGVRVLKLPAQ